VTESPDPPKRDLERLILGASDEGVRLIVETIPGLIAVMTPEGGVEHVNRQVLDEAWLSQAPLRPEVAGALPGALQDQEKALIEAALAKSRGKVAVGVPVR
jgi:hypothetical protein